MINVKKVGKFAAVFLSVFSVTGCTSLQIVDQVLEFNRGLETATNKMMLLNAVRASKRHPMYFSDITQSVASPKYEGSVGFNLPFGGDAMHLFSATPRVGVSKQNSMTLVPLNKQSFYNGILSPVDFKNVGQYIHQGWPVNTLLHMFVEKIYMSPGRLQFLYFRAVYACRNEDEKISKACKAFGESLCVFSYDYSRFCRGDMWPDLFKTINHFPTATDGEIKNDPGNDWDFALFRSVVMALWVLDLDVVPSHGNKTFNATSKEVEKKIGARGRITTTKITETQEPGARDELLLLTRLPRSHRNVSKQDVRRYCDVRTEEVPKNRCGTKLFASKKRTGDLELGGFTRSPQGMLFYLGELIEAQARTGPGDQMARSLAEQVFPIHFGRLPNAVVSVRYGNKTYSIRGDDNGRDAMQLLALVNQLFNLKKESKELPTVPTFISVGG